MTGRWPLAGAAPELASELAIPPTPARCFPNRIANYVVSAAAQFVDHPRATVYRVDVHVAEVAGSVIETDTVQATDPAPYYHGSDGRGLL
jgi:hypothetical protein